MIAKDLVPLAVPRSSRSWMPQPMRAGNAGARPAARSRSSGSAGTSSSPASAPRRHSPMSTPTPSRMRP